MRLRIEVQLGPLYVLLDPWPQDEAEDEPPSIQAVGAAEVTTERRDDHGNPGLHVGFRSGYYEE